MDEKRRELVLIGPRNFQAATVGYPLGPGVSLPVKALQSTSTRGHAWPTPGTPTTDIGGNFTTSRIKYITSSDWADYSSYAFGYEYIGGEYAYSPKFAIDEALAGCKPSSDSSLMVDGTKAISKCIPTNPVADAGTFIGELKSGLPRLIGRDLLKTKFKDYRKVGSEYLNVEFGWKPIISDLQAFGTAAMQSEKIVNQLHRDSGKNIRRKYSFPDKVEYRTGTWGSAQSASVAGSTLYPYLYNSASGTTASYTHKVTTRTWFSGCFTYHVNLGNSLQDKLARHAAEARKLFGVELTPATVWNLAPWSWALDWEGNIGDTLHNVSRFAQDGLVMRYGYIMQSKTCEITYTLPWTGRLKGGPRSSLTLNIASESKVRRRATPFGFGFDMNALDGRQLSILGALGVSRGPRHL